MGRRSGGLTSLPVYRKYLLSSERTVPLTFEKGVDESVEASMLENGYLAAAQNWEPGLNGLRVRGGWNLSATSFGPGSVVFNPPFKISGLTYSQLPSDKNLPYWAFGVNSGNGQVGYLDIAGHEGLIHTYGSSTAGAQDFARIPLALAVGQQHLLYTTAAPTVPLPPGSGAQPAAPDVGIFAWDGTFTGGGVPTASVLLNNTHSCRALIYRPGSERFYAGGQTVGGKVGTKLFFSQHGDYTQWQSKVNGTLTDNFILVGADDGFPIEDLCLWDNNVIIAKQSGIWIMSGDGVTGTNLIKLDGAHGAPGRCLVPTPYGLVILGLFNAWLWTGGLPQMITKQVELSYRWPGLSGPALFIPGYMSGAFADRWLFVQRCDANSSNTPLLVCDLSGSEPLWHVETQGEGLSSLHADPAGGAIYGAVLNSSTWGPLVTRPLPAIPTDRHLDVPYEAVTFHALTPEYWIAGPSTPQTMRHLYLRWKERTAGPGTLSVTPIFDGTAVTPLLVSSEGVGTHWTRLDFGPTVKSVQFDFSMTPPVVAGSPPPSVFTCDIEALELQQDPQPSR